ncbi:MAG: hypothetical protein V8Q82_09735 [Christensenellales bacterium]
MLKLYFKLNTASYTIHHYLNGTAVKVAPDQTGTKTIGETLTASASTALYEKYKKASVKRYDPEDNKITIGANADQNVITVYYTVPLTITANTATHTYDGQPHTVVDKNGKTYTVSGLVNDDTDASVSATVTYTDPDGSNKENSKPMLASILPRLRITLLSLTIR